PDGRAQNRRVAFVNAALRGRPIGGMPIDGGGKVAGDLCSSSGSGGNSSGNSGGSSSGNSSGRR
ncbi:MAG: carboxypeptidase regulatory-like domain-containing protein, partial [Deltaproteobacteria bacterium]|nr:carboxypeptidase regulatory-like domain-containing protein [Deltaproteobacteria bacterium]